ncbi:hypothetical protein FGO68_gene4796 [Halteria grandinella]|uniref:C2H2-type domain-containing protein n=1 Tax=Halteria grandinella TaxID=5974 RepID=A0A8J8P4J8_HALGN|nr:hypothetical protein FGO68_gene4796 [Halteria grandinella]
MEFYDSSYIDASTRCNTPIPKSKNFVILRYVRVSSGRLTNAYICTFQGCEKIFPKWHNLFDHIRIHTGEKPFKCPVKGCNATFNQTANQKKHIDTHKMGQRLQCKICYTFIPKQFMMSHIQNCSVRGKQECERTLTTTSNKKETLSITDFNS